MVEKAFIVDTRSSVLPEDPGRGRERSERGRKSQREREGKAGREEPRTKILLK